MWLWQRKKTHKKITLLTKIACLCFFMHAGLLVLIFSGRNGMYHRMSISLHKHIDYSSPIMFVPLQEKRVVQQKNTIPSASVHKTNVPLKKQTEIAEIKKAITPPAQPTVTPPQVKKKEEEQTPPQENVLQKKDREKQIPDNAIVSHDRHEVDELRKTALLQQELLKHWRPPAGFPAQTECTITYTIGHEGTLKSITIDKSSGILVYDLSAKHAIMTMNKPQWTHGKTLSITFKQ